MQAIKDISKCIDEELEDAEHYIKLAFKYKDNNEIEDSKTIADTFYTLSEDEMRHSIVLHNVGIKLIADYKANKKVVPESMQALYDYLHEKHIDKANQIKLYQEQYN